jgi:hypothetical protein
MPLKTNTLLKSETQARIQQWKLVVFPAKLWLHCRVQPPPEVNRFDFINARVATGAGFFV